MDINYSPLGFLISLFFIVTFLAPQVKSRAFYVFGDSLVDNGNNDYLVTTARADNYPYGIDYPTRRPTGRFSNGLNIPDIISEAIGMPSTLPYLSPQLTGENLLVGANFASAGIGILNDTGIQFKLYELGARRVLVTGTGAMGCAPAELAQHSRNGECYGALQTAAALFNPQLVNLIASVNAEIGQDVFVAANAYQMNMDYLTNPEQFAFLGDSACVSIVGSPRRFRRWTVRLSISPRRLRVSPSLLDDSASPLLISRWRSSTAHQRLCMCGFDLSVALLDGSASLFLSSTAPRLSSSPRRLLEDSASALLILQWLSSTTPPLRF
ncbi:hypothetical protein F2Q70_00024033 [Brassica cretica]|uniref:GDSL esterase/lipase n=1 Tax=Brassica cretica TaxID=69181 RepID=A0A8S9GQX1_BRACR|nr:hypothetical protein F2Q70_00024033 [Brassica cretica]